MDPKNVIIYSDLDGTLLSYTSDKTFINEANIKAIKNWIQLGGFFSIATGRNLKNILHLFTDFKVNSPLVLSNGALLYSQDQECITYQEKLSDEFINEALDYYKNHDYVSLVLSDSNEIYTIEHEFNSNRPELKFPYIKLQLIDVKKYNHLKLSFLVDAENADRLNEELKNFHTLDQVNISASSKRYIEVVSKKASKGLGIKKVLEMNQLESKTLVCIGDYLNDIEMLKIADIPAAPINGHEDVKRIAKIITIHHNEGAIADLIDKLLKM
ncbi:MAG: cof [Haloplasmataceae bacterium]|jgi:Cof subfamily protein (haloacid dehalogenase superfamily)|nr:cof [Haloplasmataceae bacterium]